MLSQADTSIQSIIDIFSSRRLDVAFLSPTKTACDKSIMDAVASFRNFLKEHDIHDYDLQSQGPEFKVMIPTYIITEDELVKTKTSLYRPVTKQGDPRVWVYNLNNYCKPHNLLGFLYSNGFLYVVNLSDSAIINSVYASGYVASILNNLSSEATSIARELLEKLKKIHQKGFVPTITAGDTGVGMTLESLLEIPPNPSKQPDYKGIELKSARDYRKSHTRSNLFSKVPDWKNSRGTTDKGIIEKYGYWGKDKDDNDRFNLYCTVRAGTPNPQGLFFEVDHDNDILINYALTNENAKEYVAQWDLAELRKSLLRKHSETFWVEAKCEVINKKEHFHYDSVIYTRKPNVNLFGVLIEEGIITMDYTMHLREDGSVRDHGYLFKIFPENLNKLFPDPQEFKLGRNQSL